MKFTHFKTVALMLSASALLVLSGCDGTTGIESNSGLGTVPAVTPPVTPPIIPPVVPPVDGNVTPPPFVPQTCLPDFNTMTVLGYPYQPDGLPVDLNGSGLTGLVFNSTGSKAYVTTSDAHGENHLMTIDTSTGDATLVTDGDIDNDSMDIQDLAMQPDTGTLFGVYNGDGYELVTITETADTTTIGLLPAGGGPGNVAFGPEGTLYYVKGTNLYTVNPTDTEDANVTQLSMEIQMMGLGYNAHDGLLYAASRTTWGEIYTIDPSDGNTTYVGMVNCPNGEDSCTLHDLDFNPSTGEMFGVMGGADDSTDPDDLVGAVVKWSCQTED